MDQLTDKQRMFCEEYLTDYNGSRAAVAAGYEEKNSRQTAWELLTKPYIQEYLTIRKQLIASKLGVTQERIVQELMCIAFGDFKSYYDKDGSIKNVHDFDDKAAASISSMETLTMGVKKISRYDKIRAIEVLNKMLGYNSPEKIDQTINQRSVVIDTTGEPNPEQEPTSQGDPLHSEAS